MTDEFVSKALCDFDGMPGDPPPDPATWWVYPCNDFVHAVEIAPNAKTGELSALEHGSEGEWLACPACAELVEQGPSAIPAMVARMLRRSVDKSPEAQSLYAIGLTSMYAMFFDSRDGTPATCSLRKATWNGSWTLCGLPVGRK